MQVSSILIICLLPQSLVLLSTNRIYCTAEINKYKFVERLKFPKAHVKGTGNSDAWFLIDTLIWMFLLPASIGVSMKIDEAK